MKKWKGKEEEAKAGGETVIDKMEVAGYMEVTGNMVMSGCDEKTNDFLLFFLYPPSFDLLEKTSNFTGKAKTV